MVTRDGLSEYYASLPGKRIGAGLLCRDADDRILLVQPTYKPTWELPGSVVEAGESPAACVAREVREELGVDLAVGRLLVVDWLPVRPPKTEGLMMQFDGGVLDDAVTRRFRLPADELAAWRWFSSAELDDVLPDYMSRRTRVALDAARSASSTAYLECGRLPASAEPTEPHRPVFVLMKGPSGSGKSTIARELGRRLRWPVIDTDVFRDLLPDDLGGLSYEAMLNLAERQLAIGLSVIADSPLGYGTGYGEGLAIGERTGASIFIIECECSDPVEWRRRIDGRAGTGLAAHHATDWSKVEAFHERAAADTYEVDVPVVRIDTIEPLEHSLRTVMDWLRGAGLVVAGGGGPPAMSDERRLPRARYDGYADWYDANLVPYVEAAGHDLLALLGPGPGRCLDLACGTGANLRRMTDAGWSVTGVDLSSDQLRRARARAPEGVELVQGDATALPFADASFDAVACALLHTDVDDFTAVCREAHRVLKPGGRLAYVGIHPCFVGPFARNPPGEPPELHPGYRDTSWTTEGFSDGIRRRAGAKHVQLADFINAFLEADFRLTRVFEATDEEYPTRIGLAAERPPHSEADNGSSP